MTSYLTPLQQDSYLHHWTSRLVCPILSPPIFFVKGISSDLLLHHQQPGQDLWEVTKGECDLNARTIRSISGMRWPESCVTPIGPSIMWMRLGIGLGMGSARFCKLGLRGHPSKRTPSHSQFNWLVPASGVSRQQSLLRARWQQNHRRLFIVPSGFLEVKGPWWTREILWTFRWVEAVEMLRHSGTQIGLCCNACRPIFARIQSPRNHFWSLIKMISYKSSEMMTPLNMKGYQDTREKKVIEQVCLLNSMTSIRYNRSK